MLYYLMRKKGFQLLIIAIAGIIIYSNTLHGPFVWDDTVLIRDNLRIRDLSNFKDISGTRYLTFLSFAVNYLIGGYNVAGFHIFNIAVHILNAMLVYWLVTLMLKSYQLSATTRRSTHSPIHPFTIVYGPYIRKSSSLYHGDNEYKSEKRAPGNIILSVVDSDVYEI